VIEWNAEGFGFGISPAANSISAFEHNYRFTLCD
jgi:hypothetical protein